METIYLRKGSREQHKKVSQSKVLFWRIPLKATFTVDGLVYIKVTPRQGMSEKGVRRDFKDSDWTTVSKEG